MGLSKSKLHTLLGSDNRSAKHRRHAVPVFKRRIYVGYESLSSARDRRIFEVARRRNLRFQFELLYQDDSSPRQSVKLRCKDGDITVDSKCFVGMAVASSMEYAPGSRRDFRKHLSKTLDDWMRFFYTDELPKGMRDLVALHLLANDIGCRHLLNLTAERIVLIFHSEGIESLVDAANAAARRSLYVLQAHLSEILALRVKQLRTCLADISAEALADVLRLDGLAVSDEDEVLNLVLDYYRLRPDYKSSWLTSCIRYDFLSEKGVEQSQKLTTQRNVEPVRKRWPARTPPSAHYLDLQLVLSGSHSRSINIVYQLRHGTPDGRFRMLYSKSQRVSINDDTKNVVQPVALIRCHPKMFVRLGSTLLKVDSSSAECRVITHDLRSLRIDGGTMAFTIADGEHYSVVARGHVEILTSALLSFRGRRAQLKFYPHLMESHNEMQAFRTTGEGGADLSELHGLDDYITSSFNS